MKALRMKPNPLENGDVTNIHDCMPLGIFSINFMIWQSPSNINNNYCENVSKRIPVP